MHMDYQSRRMYHDDFVKKRKKMYLVKPKITHMKTSSGFLNKSFVIGLASGIILSAVAVVIVLSVYTPGKIRTPLQGTQSGSSYSPSVGDEGTVVGWAEEDWPTPCGIQHFVWPGVLWDNDPGSTAQGAEIGTCGSIGVGTRVVCTNPSVPAQWFCSEPPPEGWFMPEIDCIP